MYVAGALIKEGVHKKMNTLLIDQLHLIFLLKINYNCFGSNSSKSLYIQMSILPHLVVCTSTSRGLFSHTH